MDKWIPPAYRCPEGAMLAEQDRIIRMLEAATLADLLLHADGTIESLPTRKPPQIILDHLARLERDIQAIRYERAQAAERACMFSEEDADV